MGMITRNHCGCTADNPTGYDPVGDPLPECSCEECAHNPCEYLAIFGKPVECEGIATWPKYTDDISYARGCFDAAVPLVKDNCNHESACIWSFRKYHDGAECTHDAATVYAVLSQHRVELFGVCEHNECLTPGTDYFSQFFPGVAVTPDGKICAEPIFGCDIPFACSGRGTTRCGYQDFYGMDGCTEVPDYYDKLTKCTKLMWNLTISGGEADLIGTTDGDIPIVYHTDTWECSTPADPKRNTLALISYPNAICPDFPHKVCIVPAYTNYRTYCDDPETACACCDAGEDTVCLDVYLCDDVDPTEFTLIRVVDGLYVTSGLDPGIPSGITEPTAPCGYFYGTASEHALLVWCDGTDYQVALYCLTEPDATLVYEVTATLEECCPSWVISWVGDNDGDPCCEPPEPICDDWTDTLSMGVNGPYAMTTGGNIIFRFVPPADGTYTFDAAVTSGSDAFLGEVNEDTADCCLTGDILDDFTVPTNGSVTLTANTNYIVCIFNAVGNNSYTVTIS